MINPDMDDDEVYYYGVIKNRQENFGGKEYEPKERDLYSFFKTWWAEGERYGYIECLECFKPLQFDVKHCAHVLSRGTEISMKFDKENIIPLCEKHHTQFDGKADGRSRKSMTIWPMIERRIKYLKHKHIMIKRKKEGILKAKKEEE